MPFKIMVPCKHPGCAALVPSGTKYCEAHKPLHPEEIRPVYKRGYEAGWWKTSKTVLHAHSLRVRCMEDDTPRRLLAIILNPIARIHCPLDG